MAFNKHPTAVVESEEIGDGTNVWHFAHIREGSTIGKNCNIGKGVYVDKGVKIGDNVKVQNFVSLYHGLVVEDDVFIGPSATFTNDLYPRAFIWSDDRVVSTTVSEGASIGANSTIVCGITIGRYAMVGAGSVVVDNVPDFALVVGNPAKQIGYVCYCGKRLGDASTKPEALEDALEIKCSSCGRLVNIYSEVGH